jgi:hypothetical protein
MSHFCLIEAVELEGFGRSGVVAPAFRDVQVTGVLDGRDDGGADGGQVGGPAAGPASRGIFAESDIPDMVVRLDRYYSHCFSVCDRAAAQRGAWFPASRLHGVTFFRPVRVRWPWPGCGCCSGASGRGPGGACASVTSGGGGEAGAGQEPGGVVRGVVGDAEAFGVGQPDRGDAGRARLPGVGGQRRVAAGNVQVSAGGVVIAGAGCSTLKWPHCSTLIWPHRGQAAAGL